MNQGPRLPLCGKWKACLQNRCSARLEPSTCQNTEWKTRRVNEHATPLAYRPFAESWSFPNKAKYADAYVAGSPLGFPAPRSCRPLGRRHSRSSIPLGPSATQTHSQRPLRVVVDGMCPSTKWQRTTPRLRESSGVAQPARRKNRFIRPPWRPNTEILPQSAGPDNPESRSGAYRGTRTIAIPPCRRAFFYHRTHRIRLRRTQKEVVKRCRPDASTTTLSQGTRSVASCRRSLPVRQRGATTQRGGTRSVASMSIPHTKVV